MGTAADTYTAQVVQFRHRLTTIEDQVEITIELKAGKGTLTGRIEAHAIAALEFEASTDQSFLAHTLEALRAVVAKYPYRG